MAAMDSRTCLFALAFAPAVAGCGPAAYVPRPSPRLQVVADGGGVALSRNGRSYSIGMFGSGLEEAVQGNRRAEEEVKSYQTKSVAGFVVGLLGSGASAGGAGWLVANEISNSPTNTARIGGITLVISGVVLSLVGTLVASSAQPHMWNAINMYNDDLPAPWGFGAPYGGQPAPGAPAYGPRAYPAAPYTVPPSYPAPSAAPMPSAPAPMPSAPAPVPSAPAPMPSAPAPMPSAPMPNAPAPVPGAPR
jgi:hypothetical protein